MKNRLLILAFLQIPLLSAQEMQFEEPTPLKVVNTNGEESMPIYDKSRKTLYIARTAHKDNIGGKKSGNEIILYDKTEQGEFVESTVDISNINNEYSNAFVGINEDGSRAYLLNQYLEGDTGMAPGLSYSDRVDKTAWSKATNIDLEGIEMDDRVYNIYVKPDESLIFMSMLKYEVDSSHNIYVIEKKGNGWGQPRMLNDAINIDSTDEITPFITDDGRFLYFASNREGGKGSFDIYRSERVSESFTEWSEPVNMEDLNSDDFDAYLFIDDESNFYFSSNRNGRLSDIFTTKVIEPKDTVESVVVDVSGPVVSFHPFVNFEFDVYKLNKSAEDYLSTIVDSLTMNPEWTVTLDGHTDSVGTNAYNLELSRKRAKSAKDFLQSNGISADRITTRQFGERMPTTSNETAIGRYLNRRVEIVFNKRKATTKEN